MQFLMNSRESSRGREGMIGNGERRRGVLDLDLNYPPPAEDSSRRYPIMGHGNGFYQDQVTNSAGLEDDDDNVLTIFPRSFAEVSNLHMRFLFHIISTYLLIVC